jgi:hypothetical protein
VAAGGDGERSWRREQRYDKDSIGHRLPAIGALRDLVRIKIRAPNPRLLTPSK